jgi:hypothetical protein
MLIAIIAVVGILAGFIAARIKYRSIIAELTLSHEEKAETLYMKGYNRGWEMASTDFFNVKKSWKRLTDPED